MENMEEIIKACEETMPGLEIKGQTVIKANDQARHAITVTEPGSDTSAVLYLDDMACGTAGETAARIKAVYEANRPSATGMGTAAAFIKGLDRETLLKRVQKRIMNRDRNRQYLEGCVWEPFLDEFAAVYYISVTENAIANIRGEMMERLDVSMAELKRAADTNLEQRPFIMHDFCGDMRVLSTPDGLFGASLFMQKDIFSRTAEALQSDIAILPSSVHELILVPVGEGDDTRQFSDIVQEVNRDGDLLKPDEFLSDHAYVYHRESGEIRIA